MLLKKFNPKVRLDLSDTLFMYKVFIGLLCFVITLFIVISGAAPVKYDLSVDDPSVVDIFAPRDIVDKLTTQRLKDEAESKVLPQYDFDQNVTKRSQEKIYAFLSDVHLVRGMHDISEQAKIDKLKQLSNIKLTDEMFITCIKMSDNELSQLQITVLNAHTQIMDRGIEADSLEKSIGYAKELIQKMEVSQKIKDLSYNILSDVIEPNKIINEQKTLAAREAARNNVEPKLYKKGEKIVGKGEKVKLEHIKVLDELGLLKDNEKRVDYRFIIGITFIVILVFLIIVAYLYYFNKKIFNDRSDLILLGLIFIFTLLIAIGFKQLSIYIIPVSAATMLIAILLDTNLAILVNFVLSVLIGLLTKGDTNFIYITLLSGSFAAFAITKTYQRNKLVLAGIAISIVNALLIISFGLLGTNELKFIFSEALNGIFNGLLSIVITIGTLPFWEATFNIITPFKLLELSNPNQPLIKRLLLEAPGTYHHSLMVGNLAEAATEAIGGNALLARVAAYYHDIGKLKRPYFFKENQFDDNPHNRMTANLSTLVITSHTKDGEEMAKANKIPLVIRDIIKQHHGTTLVAYFYHKAKNGEKAELVNANDFRYEGPKPQTKEAAVVMLADCVEAAVRSMAKRTEGKIEGMVRKIIKDKLDDGQLDMCDLTLKDLDDIAKAFLRVFSGFFHERIEYPEATVKKDDEILIPQAEKTGVD
ncbi:MAG: cyclic-di-AMP phosphodiesterase PgpH [Clostridiales bacterium]|jgi:hypothetical protein|nr:cyclic-di-AMP phosphodiesterase PgpH [Clostridiales bacterium]MDK2932455.1 cyclic-di-AMP phosphodiesterase PgpH [Clostridiales bacterium]